MIEYSPEFDEYGPEVIHSAVFEGAAKVSRIISDRSVDRLKILVDKSVDSPVEMLAPELGGVIDSLLTPENNRLGMVCLKELFTVDAMKTTGVPHKDSKKLRLGYYGLSLLLPLMGGEAFFAADEKYFELFNSEYKTPDKFWTYGPGDGIFIRQRLNEIDGVWYPNPEFNQMWHVGWGAENRLILGLDFKTRGIVLPGSDVERPSSKFKLIARSVLG